MKKKVILSLLFVSCISMLTTSCSKDSEEKEIVVELTVSEESVTLDDNNKAVISVSSNTSWTAYSSDSWLDCSPSEGTNNQDVTISAISDNTSNADRTGTVIIKDKSGKKSITISIIQNITLAPLDVVTDLVVPFTDGVTANFKYGKNVVSWYFLVTTKDFAMSSSDSEIINYLKSECSPITEKYALYTSHNTQNSNWYVPNTEYYICTAGVDASGEFGNLTRRLFKTNAVNLPLAEITKVQLSSTTPKKWNIQVVLKNGASDFYSYGIQSIEAYNVDDYFLAFMAYREIVLNNARLANGTEGYYDYSGNQIVLCTWAVNPSGKVGNCYVARNKGNNQSPKKAEYVINNIPSEICPHTLGKMYTNNQVK